MTFAVGSLVQSRGREWVVLPDSTADFLVLRPLGGADREIAGVYLPLEGNDVRPAAFDLPDPDRPGDFQSCRLLRDALRIGFRSSAGPFRSLASLAVEPRSYQYVPLLMALRQDTVRLLISDDVGIGKTVEAGLIAAELLATGQARGLSVLCSPALAEQWADELRDKFGLDATLVLPSTATRLQRGLGLDESIFGRYPVTVVSTDFIKSPVRRDEYVRAAPDLLIVDEAHTAVSDGTGQGGGKGRTQRHELLRRLAADRQRHLLLVTATPHSGQDTGFRNLLELLDEPLAYIDLDQQQDRALLARYFVQRRRGDIRRYLDQDTPFPRDRESQERPYKLDPAYRDLFDDVLEYARSSVLDEDGQTVRQRVRWWSALALLRSLASSPAAAAATLRTRATNAAAASPDEADTLGRASVLDLADDEAIESMDTTPGALTTDEEQTPERRKLLTFARAAEALQGPKSDVKLKELFKSVDALLREGYHPIVFCRYIPTAEYVGEHLTAHLGKRARCAVVTGTLPPAERVARIAELTDEPGPVVLVATDCLSEGVNLQESFDAVLHYDLAWNPTRHEQREGRVDQRRRAGADAGAALARAAQRQARPAFLHGRVRGLCAGDVP
jgi:SNF2 family DNA or RNA helicase